MRKTYLHKGYLKPGTYSLIGQYNKAKDGNLHFERIIGDFLVDKGLASTTDNCVYTINCCAGFTFTYEDGQICFGIGAESVCIELDTDGISTTINYNIGGTDYPSGTDLTTLITSLINYINSALSTVQTENGLSGVGSSGDKVRLGGTLNQNTTITGNYTVTWSGVNTYTITVEGGTADGLLRVSGLQSQPSTLRHIKDDDSNVVAMVNLDHDTVFGLEYQDANGLIGFRIYPTEDDSSNTLALRTKGIRDATQNVNDVPRLIDPITGEFEWGPSVISFDTYDDDTAAGIGGVSIGDPYALSGANPYGLPEGTIKLRIA